MKKIISLAAAVLLTFSLASCATGGTDSSLPAPDIGYVGDETAPDKGGAGAVEDGTVTNTDRSVIRTATAYLSAEDPADAAEKLASLVLSKQGRVDQKNIYKDSDGLSIRADLILRVPSDKLDSVIEELKNFGSVQSLELGASDVTVSVRDLEARVKALETSVARLLDLLANANDTTDLIQIETALTERQAELDGLKSTLSYYQDAVSFATLSVTIVTEADALPNTPDNFWEGIVSGFNALVDFLAGAVVFLGVVLPWLIALGVPIALVVYFVTKRLRMTKKKAKTKKR